MGIVANKEIVKRWRKKAVVRTAQRYALFLAKIIADQAGGKRLFTIGIDCPLPIGKHHRSLLRVKHSKLRLVAKFVLMDGKEERLTGDSPAVIFAKWYKEASDGKSKPIAQALESLLQELWFTPQNTEDFKAGDGLNNLLSEDIGADRPGK